METVLFEGTKEVNGTDINVCQEHMKVSFSILVTEKNPHSCWDAT